MIEEVGIDSIYGYGKTNKLDVYITYNFNALLGEKTLHWPSEVDSTSQGGHKPCN
jgi:hypothetical protein